MNDKAIKKCDCCPTTKSDILECGTRKWYQGNYCDDVIVPRKITTEMRERIVKTCSGLFEKQCLSQFGTILGVPFVTILPHGQQRPRMVLVFDKDNTQLRRNDQLLMFRFNEQELTRWDVNDPEIAKLVENVVMTRLTTSHPS